MTITNSTIVANSAAGGGAAGTNGIPTGPGPGPGPGQPGVGGGIDQRAMGTTLTHVTITANSAGGVGGGVDGAGGTVTVANSIIAGNVAAPPSLNCAGVLVDQGGNLEFAAASCPAGFFQANPKLTGLADNGGPTQTIALQPGSAAIHHVRTCVLTPDQRGVARPVGAACDSGAYQVAPPSLSGISAGGITTTSATIAAAVNPNLQDTKVVVNYGLTPSYGSSTPLTDLGAGNSPAPFSAPLSGLVPGATYHFDVVAINADGQTTSSDATFTTLPPLTASIAGASTVGPALALTVACNGGSGPGTCAGTIRLTSRVRLGRGRAHTVKVAGGSYSVSTGRRVTVEVKLNRLARRLLSERYALATSVKLDGTTPLSRSVTFSYPVIKSPISFTWNFAANGSALATELDGDPHTPRREGDGHLPRRRLSVRQAQVCPPTSECRPGAGVRAQSAAPRRHGRARGHRRQPRGQGQDLHDPQRGASGREPPVPPSGRQPSSHGAYDDDAASDGPRTRWRLHSGCPHADRRARCSRFRGRVDDRAAAQRRQHLDGGPASACPQPHR